jgi:hypothetical protein
MESVWLLLGGLSIPSGQPDLGFLGLLPFRCETQGLWVLDFFGFSRANRDFSIGYADKAENNFSSRFRRRERAVETVSPRFGMAKGRIAHGASLTRFLIFCKILPPGAVPFWPPPSKSNSL